MSQRAASELSSSAGDVIHFVREALSNGGCHAAAATCRVTLRQNDESRITLEIDDDGSGFDAPGDTGMGLGNLRARVEAMGGTYSLRSAPGEGTAVTALLPR